MFVHSVVDFKELIVGDDCVESYFSLIKFLSLSNNSLSKVYIFQNLNGMSHLLNK